jgi:hypothetical protein
MFLVEYLIPVYFEFFIEEYNLSQNAFYIMDFGDGSLIENPKSVLESNLSLNYSYRTSGLFTTNLTVFNSVSTISQIVKV